MNYVLWQKTPRDTWVRLTQPVPLSETERMRDASLASIPDFEYMILPENKTP